MPSSIDTEVPSLAGSASRAMTAKLGQSGGARGKVGECLGRSLGQRVVGSIACPSMSLLAPHSGLPQPRASTRLWPLCYPPIVTLPS